jgi:hypothetical protein
MPIQLITGFTVNNSTPLDNRIVASGSVARNSIPYKYTGMRVFDTSDNRGYYYNGSTFSAEITDQVNGAAGYVPVFTSQNYIGSSGIFQVSAGTEKRIGVGTNNPLGTNTYMQFGGMVGEDPNYFPGQSLPLTIIKGTDAIISYNWLSGSVYFDSSKGSSSINFGNAQGDLIISNRLGGAGSMLQTIYLSNNNRVGIGSNWAYNVLPSEALDVTGSIKTSGYFKGDGSQLTVGTASALQTTRTIWGQSFNGTQNINGTFSSTGDIYLSGGTFRQISSDTNFVIKTTVATSNIEIIGATGSPGQVLGNIILQPGTRSSGPLGSDGVIRLERRVKMINKDTTILRSATQTTPIGASSEVFLRSTGTTNAFVSWASGTTYLVQKDYDRLIEVSFPVGWSGDQSSTNCQVSIWIQEESLSPITEPGAAGHLWTRIYRNTQYMGPGDISFILPSDNRFTVEVSIGSNPLGTNSNDIIIRERKFGI